MEPGGTILEIFRAGSTSEGLSVLIPAADSSQLASASGLEKHHFDLYLYLQAILPVPLPEHPFYKSACQTGLGTASLFHGLILTN